MDAKSGMTGVIYVQSKMEKLLPALMEGKDAQNKVKFSLIAKSSTIKTNVFNGMMAVMLARFLI